MSSDPTNLDPAAIRQRLDAARDAFHEAEKRADEARDAADAAGSPRYYGATHHEAHVAEREAIDALIDANVEYENALAIWKTFLDLNR